MLEDMRTVDTETFKSSFFVVSSILFGVLFRVQFMSVRNIEASEESLPRMTRISLITA
jgi:hypothetical protein